MGKTFETIENFINYSYSEDTENIPAELQMEKDCTLGMQKYVEYPPGKDRIDWEKKKIGVRERLKLKAEKRSKYNKTKILELEIGQKEIIRRDRTSRKVKKQSAKLSAIYQGPLEVRKRIGKNTYLIKLNNDSRKDKIHNIVNLYPYNSRRMDEK